MKNKKGQVMIYIILLVIVLIIGFGLFKMLKRIESLEESQIRELKNKTITENITSNQTKINEVNITKVNEINITKIQYVDFSENLFIPDPNQDWNYGFYNEVCDYEYGFYGQPKLGIELEIRRIEGENKIQYCVKNYPEYEYMLINGEEIDVSYDESDCEKALTKIDGITYLTFEYKKETCVEVDD